MKRDILHRFAASISMLAFLPVMIGGAGVFVLCHGSDGHVAIEVAHAGHCGSCGAGCADGAEDARSGRDVMEIASSPGRDHCSDSVIHPAGPMLASDSKRYEGAGAQADVLQPNPGHAVSGIIDRAPRTADHPPDAHASLTCLKTILIRI